VGIICPPPVGKGITNLPKLGMPVALILIKGALTQKKEPRITKLGCNQKITKTIIIRYLTPISTLDGLFKRHDARISLILKACF